MLMSVKQSKLCITCFLIPSALWYTRMKITTVISIWRKNISNHRHLTRFKLNKFISKSQSIQDNETKKNKQISVKGTFKKIWNWTMQMQDKPQSDNSRKSPSSYDRCNLSLCTKWIEWEGDWNPSDSLI